MAEVGLGEQKSESRMSGMSVAHGKVETVTDFIFLGSKITADSDCSHKIKRRLLLGRKAITNLRQCIKKQRYHFADKGPYSQSYGFSQKLGMKARVGT